MKIEKKLYKILKWASNKARFTEQELFDKFPELNSELKEWYLNTFRGASDNNDCLIGVYAEGDSFYLSLTAKGQSEYSRIKKKTWRETLVKILFILGAIASIISLVWLSLK